MGNSTEDDDDDDDDDDFYRALSCMSWSIGGNELMHSMHHVNNASSIIAEVMKSFVPDN